ncbi:MAG: C1 family peptidase [Solidesulfovibrio sp. DCME]|uniref:C1 family peptidase n=1 Tax=Solidesulfovibrio sp. DCME TaxID=3447380 RepID=UPI003D0E3BBF
MSRAIILVLIVIIKLSDVGWADTKIFQNKNIDSINSVNAHLAQRGATWKAGETFITKMPDDQRKALFSGGALLPPNLDEIKAQHKPLTPLKRTNGVTPLPVKFDWRNVNGVNYVTPVKNQGGCGACVMFATTAVLESLIRINTYADRPLWTQDFSEQYILSCMSSIGCTGSYLDEVLNDLIKDQGTVIERYAPYQEKVTDCATVVSDEHKTTAGRYKIQNWYDPGTDLETIKRTIVEKGPFVATIYATSEFQSYVSGIYQSTKPGGMLSGYHVVEVIGYDDDQKCFIIKNSWGNYWGEDGYGRIAYAEASASSYTQFLNIFNTVMEGSVISQAEPNVEYRAKIPNSDIKYSNFNYYYVGIVATGDVLFYKYRMDGGDYSEVKTVGADGLIMIDNLYEGLHTLEMIGCDFLGNWQSTPTVYTFTVDLTFPIIIPTQYPDAITNQTKYTLTWRGINNIDDVVGYRFSLDEETYLEKPITPVSQPAEFTITRDGEHYFWFYACDRAGNCMANNYTWIVDTVAPIGKWTTPPDPITTEVDYYVLVDTSDEQAVVYKYSLDGGDWVEQSAGIYNGIRFYNLSRGTHVLKILAKDIAGNWQNVAAPTVYTWTIVDPAAPVAKLMAYPGYESYLKTGTITVGGDNVVAYKYRIDGGAYSNETSVSTPITYNLNFGQHTIEIVGKNSQGTWQTGSTMYTWNISQQRRSVPLAALQLLLR